MLLVASLSELFSIVTGKAVSLSRTASGTISPVLCPILTPYNAASMGISGDSREREEKKEGKKTLAMCGTVAPERRIYISSFSSS